ncbi:hypothetical protein D3C80_623920 [compost metagenome]
MAGSGNSLDRAVQRPDGPVEIHAQFLIVRTDVDKRHGQIAIGKGFERMAQPVHRVGLPLGCGTQEHLVALSRLLQRPLLVSLTRLQGAALIDAVAQDQKRLGNRADFVAAVGELDFGRAVTIRDTLHALPDQVDRRRHAAHDGGGHTDDEKAGQAAQADIKIGVVPESRLEVIDINTRADNPAPGRKAGNMGKLLHRFRRAGFRPVIVDKALTARLHRIHKFDEQRLAVRILVRGEVSAVHFRLDRMHHHFGMHVVDPEITAAIVITHGGDGRLGLLLRRLPAQTAALLHTVILLQNGDGGFVHRRQSRFPLAFHLVVTFKQAESQGCG